MISRTFAATGSASALIVPAFAEISFQPAEPCVDDAVTVTVTRTFEADCLWRIEPNLQRDGSAINLMLKLSGEDVCDGVITKMTFDVDIGRLPAGTYDVRVRWSDENNDEKTRLQVFKASCEN